MRNLKFYLFNALIIAITFLGSCTKKLLDPIPPSILTTANAYSDAKSINLAVLGVYQSLASRIQTDYLIMELPSDNMWLDYAITPGSDQINTLSLTPQNEVVNDFWKACYRGIFRANTVLANIDNPSDYNNEKKNQYIGEVKFLRAKFYFDLVRIFGGVPKVTDILTAKEAKEVPRASVGDIYDLIVKDLSDAVKKLPLPSKTTWGRASKGAAVSLLAKVFVYMKDWQRAKIYLKQLFTEFHYTLLNQYKDLFRTESEQNSEVIFSIPFVEGSNGQALTYTLAPIGGILDTVYNGRRVARPTWDLRSKFQKGDTRLYVTLHDWQYTFNYKTEDDLVWYPYFNKWIVPISSQSSGLDIPVLRLGDMILLNAEVQYHLNNNTTALNQINKIRARAFHNSSHNYSLNDISTKEKFYDKLLLERRLELAVENNRWFDLVRTGRFVKVLQNVKGEYGSLSGNNVVTIPVHAKQYMEYFPIPQEQIDLADEGVLKQNVGY